MRFRTLFVIVLVAVIAIFAALNWEIFTTATKLSLGIATVDAPLGLVMLLLLVGVVLLFAGYMAVWQAALLVESRRHAKELQAQRALAEEAEASRLTELRGALTQATQNLERRFDEVRDSFRNELRDGINSLAAMIGEIDDRLKRDAADRP
jgi:uncharacterized integral membrane protein